MTNTKIKPELNGVAETMLLTFYARAKYSKSPKHAFYDAKAVELAERLDYDFSKASRDVAMGNVINLKRPLNGKQNVWKYQNGEEKSDSDGREKDV